MEEAKWLGLDDKRKTCIFVYYLVLNILQTESLSERKVYFLRVVSNLVLKNRISCLFPLLTHSSVWWRLEDALFEIFLKSSIQI